MHRIRLEMREPFPQLGSADQGKPDFWIARAGPIIELVRGEGFHGVAKAPQLFAGFLQGGDDTVDLWPPGIRDQGNFQARIPLTVKRFLQG